MEPMYAGNKLSDDSQKYGVENTCTSGDTLSRAATYFAKARSLMEKERGNMLKAFGTQVCIPNAGSGFSCAPNCKKNWEYLNFICHVIYFGKQYRTYVKISIWVLTFIIPLKHH
jgi:hypothetical protein